MSQALTPRVVAKVIALAADQHTRREEWLGEITELLFEACMAADAEDGTRSWPRERLLEFAYDLAGCLEDID